MKVVRAFLFVVPLFFKRGIQKKRQMGDDASGDTFANIFQNAILPLDPRKMKVLMGSAQYIAVEVLVSQLVRRIMKAPQSWTDTILVHTLSMPFMGGAAGFGDRQCGVICSWMVPKVSQPCYSRSGCCLHSTRAFTCRGST